MLVNENRVWAMGKEFLTRTGNDSQQMQLVPPFHQELEHCGAMASWSGMTLMSTVETPLCLDMIVIQ